MHAAGLHGDNMEGKEQRFGIASSALLVAVTTAASCGAVNAAMESLTGFGGVVPMAQMMTGEVIFGGVGSGLYGMLLFVILGVFICRPDGRPHAGVPRQEDRGARDQAHRHRHDRRADDGAGRHRARDRREVGHAVDLRLAARRASPRRSTPTRRRPTTTARRSPATRASSSPTARTPARSASRSPTCSAAWRCSSAASCRCSPCSPSPARWPASGSRPAGLGHAAHRHADLRRRPDRASS